MFNLLGLPYEVRAQILSYLVRYVAEAPTEAETEQRVLTHEATHKPRRLYRRTAMMVRPEGIKAAFRTSRAIFLVSKQIHHEACAVSKTLRSVHHLDLVVFRKAIYTIPNWTYLSVPVDDVDVLMCTIRLHGNFLSARERSPFTAGDGGPPKLVWRFYDLLNNYFKYGPPLQRSNSTADIDGRYLIKRLLIDVRSPTLEAGEEWFGEPGEHRRDMRVGITQRLHPERFLLFLAQHMGFLFNGNRDSIVYGETIFMHVGQIEFRLDGVTTKVIDLSSRLDAILSEPAPISWPYKPEPYISEGRRYYARQLWATLMKRLRADHGFTSQAQPEVLNNKQLSKAGEKDFSYWMSWDECLKSAKLPKCYVNHDEGIVRPIA